MNHNRKSGATIVILMLLALLMSPQFRTSPSAAWQFRLEFASVRLSISSGAAPVRNRAVLFDIGQVLSGVIALR